MYTGRCLCGQVNFSIQQKFIQFSNVIAVCAESGVVLVQMLQP